jgi:hypothetical protein
MEEGRNPTAKNEILNSFEDLYSSLRGIKVNHSLNH